MFEVIIPGRECFDNEKNIFFNLKETKIVIEHSLISMAKWESKWKKPLLEIAMSNTEFIDYVRCMTLDKNIDKNIYNLLTVQNQKDIRDYMNNSMTATTFSKRDQKPGKKKIITSEYLYFLMFSNGIPIECEKWHLNRLLTLIKIFVIENEPPKRMKPNDVLSQNRMLNKARRAGRKG